MSWQRYPNANYPEAYDEDNMVKATDVPVNEDGGLAEIQSVWNDASGGTFTFSYDGQGPTGALVFDADNVSINSEGNLTIAEPVTDGDQFTLDSQEYTLLDTTLAAYDIAIGGSEAATKVNIVAAINASGTEGVEYHAGTNIHPTVSAAAFVVDDCVLTAKVPGTTGNAIATTETGQGLTDVLNVFDDTTLGATTDGVNGIVTELEVLSNITNVSITGDGTLSVPWLIEFLDPSEEDIVLLTADDGNLTGDTIGTTITEYLKGRKSLEVTTASGGPL